MENTMLFVKKEKNGEAVSLDKAEKKCIMEKQVCGAAARYVAERYYREESPGFIGEG